MGGRGEKERNMWRHASSCFTYYRSQSRVRSLSCSSLRMIFQNQLQATGSSLLRTRPLSTYPVYHNTPVVVDPTEYIPCVPQHTSCGGSDEGYSISTPPPPPPHPSVYTYSGYCSPEYVLKMAVLSTPVHT